MTMFQNRVAAWMFKCFGFKIANDKIERNHRFLEEALELVQACDCTASEAHQLVEYVFNRPVGEKHQEVGGAIVTLTALCEAHKLDLNSCGHVEMDRIESKDIMNKIRKKQAAKPKYSPLPQ